MIDTNQINQAAAVAADVKQQVQLNWTAIVFAVALISRELKNFNAWCLGVAEFVIKHGGMGRILVKLLWTPDADQNRLGAPVSTSIPPGQETGAPIADQDRLVFCSLTGAPAPVSIPPGQETGAPIPKTAKAGPSQATPTTPLAVGGQSSATAADALTPP